MKSVYSAVRTGSLNNTDVFVLQILNINFVDFENISYYWNVFLFLQVSVGFVNYECLHVLTSCALHVMKQTIR